MKAKKRKIIGQMKFECSMLSISSAKGASMSRLRSSLTLKQVTGIRRISSSFTVLIVTKGCLQWMLVKCQSNRLSVTFWWNVNQRVLLTLTHRIGIEEISIKSFPIIDNEFGCDFAQSDHRLNVLDTDRSH